MKKIKMTGELIIRGQFCSLLNKYINEEDETTKKLSEILGLKEQNFWIDYMDDEEIQIHVREANISLIETISDYENWLKDLTDDIKYVFKVKVTKISLQIKKFVVEDNDSTFEQKTSISLEVA